MATIRPQQMGAVDYGASNSLLQNAQQMILGGLGGIGTTAATMQKANSAKNTAAALSTLAMVQDKSQLAAAQNQVNQIAAQSGGDIDMSAIAKAQAGLPDTLANRQLNDMKLQAAAVQQHDAPLAGQYMQQIMSGDITGAKNTLAQFQGDATEAVKFNADWQNKQQQLQISQGELSLRKAALAQQQTLAAQRQAGTNALLKALPGLLDTPNQVKQASATRDAAAATDQAQQAANDNPLNLKDTAANWATKNTNGMFSFGVDGNDIYQLAIKNPAFNALSEKQKLNSLQGMLEGAKSRDGSLAEYVNSTITKQTGALNNAKIKVRQQQDAEDRLKIGQNAQDQLNKVLLPLFLQQQ